MDSCTAGNAWNYVFADHFPKERGGLDQCVSSVVLCVCLLFWALFRCVLVFKKKTHTHTHTEQRMKNPDNPSD